MRCYTSWRRTLSLVSLIILALSSSSAGSALAGSGTGGEKTESAVLSQVAGGGKTTFWALLRQRADLSRAPTIRNRTERGRFVLDQLRSVADASQRGLRALLKERGVEFRPFFIVNTVEITAGASVLNEVAARPEVEKILASRTYRLPRPLNAAAQSPVGTAEWNLDRINAPQVWTAFGDRGDGIVVANIDTGVQFDHPALVRQYRGNLGGGNFDHNYNWYDPANVCGTPSLVPCDNMAHGTHTMGTMVGDDGDPGPNEIGVAPHAKWIAAKGCETWECSQGALLASAQWVLAPTDLNGQNPRTDLRPDVVNNSWGGESGDPFFMGSVDAWVAAGIFPVFSNGNSGPYCASVGSPADYPSSYGVGAFDLNNNVAEFSSRGPSDDYIVGKPNIAAPGVSVRSSVPTSSYAWFSGTSMAAPHVAGTVALIWSVAPIMRGNIPSTAGLLGATAVDMPDGQCGGSSAFNNVWGDGHLDAFAAVDWAPRGPVGSATLTGTLTDASTNDPVSGATVTVTGPAARKTTTDASGHFSAVSLPGGTYDISASKFRYQTQTADAVVVTEGQTTTQNFALQPLPLHQVSGYVRDEEGNPLALTSVTILNTPLPSITTDANGFYNFASVPEGSYDLRAREGRCTETVTQQLVVDGDESLDFAVRRRHDNSGYFCQLINPNWIGGDTPLQLYDDTSLQVSLPFPFTFYGQTYSTAFVTPKGYLNFASPDLNGGNGPIPGSGEPNAAIYPFWDDLCGSCHGVSYGPHLVTKLIGSAPNRRFVIEWPGFSFYWHPWDHPDQRLISFEIVLYENGRILTQYSVGSGGRERGGFATIGIENADGTDGLQYSLNEATIEPGSFAVLYFALKSAPKLWASRFNGPGNGTDFGNHLAISPDGKKVFVTGKSYGGAATRDDYVTIAYNTSTGAKLWASRYNGPANGADNPSRLAVSPDGTKVFVTGRSAGGSTSGDAYATIAYNASTGTQLWASRYNGPVNGSDGAQAVAVSSDGSKVFVTGDSYGGSTTLHDYATVAYNASTGAKLWASRYNGPANGDDAASSLAVTGDGSKVLVVGRSNGGATGEDYATLSYNASTGAKLWASRYNGPGNGSDSASALALNPAGTRVFVTGRSYGGATTKADAATVAYNASNGTKAWASRFNGPGNGDDGFAAIAVNADGSKVFAAGEMYAGSLTDTDYSALAYDASNGVRLWTSRYNGLAGGSDRARALAYNPVDKTVFVTGESWGGTVNDDDAATVAFNASNGVKLWASRHNGAGSRHDSFDALGVGANGTKLFVTGETYTDLANGLDILTAAYPG